MFRSSFSLSLHRAWAAGLLLLASAAPASTSVERLSVDDRASTHAEWSVNGASTFLEALGATPADRDPNVQRCDQDETYVSTRTNSRLIASLSNPRFIDPAAVVTRLRILVNAKNLVPRSYMWLMLTQDGETFTTYTVRAVSTAYFPANSLWISTRPDGEPFAVADLPSLRFVAQSVEPDEGDWRISKAHVAVEFVPQVPVACAQAQPQRVERNGGPLPIDNSLLCEGSGELASFSDRLVLEDFLVNMPGQPRFSAVSIDLTYRVHGTPSDDMLLLEYSFDDFETATTIEGPRLVQEGTYDRKLVLPAEACPGGCTAQSLRKLAVRLSGKAVRNMDDAAFAFDCARVLVTPEASQCDPLKPGRAASYTLAELGPNEVPAGEREVAFEAFIQPSVSTALKDTGVNVVTLLPGSGFGGLTPSSVHLGEQLLKPGVDYQDTSAKTAAKDDLQLTLSAKNKLTSRKTLRVRFAANAPRRPAQARFACTVDDSATPKVGPQPCVEGNAHSAWREEGELNSLSVRVVDPKSSKSNR